MAVKFIIDDGRTRAERTIEEIVDAEGKISLGVASGMDIMHCFYIASRYCRTTKNFLRDVDYYRICDRKEALERGLAITRDPGLGITPDPGLAITLEFYKKAEKPF